MPISDTNSLILHAITMNYLAFLVLFSVSTTASLASCFSHALLSEDSARYIKFTLTNQVWVRYNQSNPGTTVNGQAQPYTTDIGIRRSRLQVYGAPGARSFVYIQMGMNNFNYLSERKPGLFLHDAIAEYSIVPKYMSLGAGLTNWTGLSRISNAAIASFLPMDSPIFPFATIDATDQFNRKLSLYAKGKLGKLDYRIALSDPLIFTRSNLYNPNTAPGQTADFSPVTTSKQSHAYLMYQFLDQESNLTPFLPGTYLGRKRVFNIGGGYIYQPDATWHASPAGDTLFNAMAHFCVDMFADLTISPRNDALTVYAAVFNYNFGPGYLRNVGIMNPANSTIPAEVSFNGPGNAYPVIGTGSIYYVQTGFIPGSWLKTTAKFQLQPYVTYKQGNYHRLSKASRIYHAGINTLLNGNSSKITLDWQYRPIYFANGSEPLTPGGYRSAITLQFQIAI